MISRVCWVSGATLALLTVASACPGAESGYAPRRGSLGGLIGISQTFADGDYAYARDARGDFGSGDTRARFAFAGNFRYVISPWLRWQVSPGFFWAGYDEKSPMPFADPNFPTENDKQSVLTLVIPISAQLQITHAGGGWIYHAGGGPGVYRVWVENRRKVLKDPVTKKLHRGFYPGASAELGAEHFLKSLPSTAIEISAAAHWAFADRPEQFPSGFNSALLATELRAGANYYFDVARFNKPKRPGAPATKR